MLKEKYEKIEGVIILFYFICQIALDFIQKINARLNLDMHTYHRYLKVLFLFYIFVKTLMNIKFLYKNSIFKYVTILFILFLFSKNYKEQRIEYLIQYSYFFGLVLFYLKYKVEHLKLIQLIKILVITNFIFILVGIIFDINIFYTYGETRFGYNGFIITPMQSTVFYLSCIALSLYLNDILLIVVTLISAMLCGTKALLLGVPILVFLLYFISNKNQNYRYLPIFVLCSSLFGLIGLFKTNLFKSIVEKDGVFTMIFSHRDQLFLKTIRTLKGDYSFLDFLIGGYDLSIYKTELDFVDIVIFFGVIGLCVFIFIFKYLYKNYCISNVSKSYFITILIVAFFAGNIIVYPVNSFLFLTILKLIYDRGENYT